MFMFDPLDVDVSIGDECPLPVELRVKLCVLALAIVINCALLVHLRPECLDETDVRVDPRLIIFIHTSFFFVQPPKVLLHVH